MKRLLILLLAIVGMAIGLASCQKGNPSDARLIGTWKVVSSTDSVHYPVNGVTWTFGANTVTISYDGDYQSGSYRVDGKVLVLSREGRDTYITIVELSSSTLVLSIEGVTVKFQRV